eukprot:scaffold6631_cov90-Isochrysis_galbana.AAC.2
MVISGLCARLPGAVCCLRRTRTPSGGDDGSAGAVEPRKSAVGPCVTNNSFCSNMSAGIARPATRTRSGRSCSTGGSARVGGLNLEAHRNTKSRFPIARDPTPLSPTHAVRAAPSARAARA